MGRGTFSVTLLAAIAFAGCHTPAGSYFANRAKDFGECWRLQAGLGFGFGGAVVRAGGVADVGLMQAAWYQPLTAGVAYGDLCPRDVDRSRAWEVELCGLGPYLISEGCTPEDALLDLSGIGGANWGAMFVGMKFCKAPTPGEPRVYLRVGSVAEEIAAGKREGRLGRGRYGRLSFGLLPAFWSYRRGWVRDQRLPTRRQVFRPRPDAGGTIAERPTPVRRRADGLTEKLEGVWADTDTLLVHDVAPPKTWTHARLHAFDVEASAFALFLGVRAGFSPGEFVDFLLGWTGLDIAGDDRPFVSPEPARSRRDLRR